MTAPATPRIPTPGDLARRPPATAPTPPVSAPKSAAAPDFPEPGQPYQPRKFSPEDALKPGNLTKREHFRKHFLFGMRTSHMHPHARLVGHDLMWRASHATGRISPSLQPSTEQLAQAAGLTAAQVDVALQVLHTRGWLQHRRLQEGPRAGQTAYSLAIPAAALEGIRAWIAENPREFRR
ncbi:hypothetical protein [Streptomyces kebangsaanensis]|uniref:hypothetical protein n=1 Tax=Streptomyces kebangsaanensis TaxID=864058 RepID=UPI00093AD2A4|nr:hypothetical protein [Streptomyces kebangsaanensis]